jgi:hypothetical protein
MVALPRSNVSLISDRRCPNRASVSTARAWIYCVFSGGGMNWLAYMFTVRLSRLDRSGSCAASARKSTWARGGSSGGSIWPWASARLSPSTSSPHYISSCWLAFSSRRVLIVVGMVLQVIQTVQTPNDFLHQFYYTQKIFTPSWTKVCTLKHLNTARGWVITVLFWYIASIWYNMCW